MADHLSSSRIVDAEFTAAAATDAQLPPPQFAEIAFAGRSNVGKSTLMNAIMGRRKLVRTSSTPGCTRTISFFKAVTAEKQTMMLVDLPGYGFAQRSLAERKQWATLIEGYLLDRPTLRGVVLLVDARRDYQSDDLDLIELLRTSTNINRVPPAVVLVATKLDQVSSSQRQTRVRQLQQQVKQRVYGLSAQDPPTVAQFWQDIQHLCVSKSPLTGDPEASP